MKFPDVFKKNYALINTQFNEQIRIFRSNNGREYVSTFLGQFFSEKGIVHQSSCVQTP